MLSTAKAEAVARDLKQSLEKRGFVVVESNLAKGKKLAVGDYMSIRMEAKDAVSKDVFGNSLDAFTPHEVKFAIDQNIPAIAEAVKVMMDLAKIGFAIKIGESGSLAAAEGVADTAEAQPHNVQWPTKGA